MAKHNASTIIFQASCIWHLQMRPNQVFVMFHINISWVFSDQRSPFAPKKLNSTLKLHVYTFINRNSCISVYQIKNFITGSTKNAIIYIYSSCWLYYLTVGLPFGIFLLCHWLYLDYKFLDTNYFLALTLYWRLYSTVIIQRIKQLPYNLRHENY